MSVAVILNPVVPTRLDRLEKVVADLLLCRPRYGSVNWSELQATIHTLKVKNALQHIEEERAKPRIKKHMNACVLVAVPVAPSWADE